MMLFALVGLMPAKAQTNLYWSVGSDCVIEPQEGAYYVLDGVGVNPSTTDILCGYSTLGSANAECIYQFEPAGVDADGNKLWRLLWISQGTYLEDPDKSGAKVSYTSKKSDAFVFTVLKAVPSELGYKDALAEDPNTDLRSYHYNGQNHVCDDECVVLCNKNYQSSNYRWFE